MTKFCDHAYDGNDPLREDCDCCTLKRGHAVGFLRAEHERSEIRREAGKDVTRFRGGIRFGKGGWQTFSMRGEPLD